MYVYLNFTLGTTKSNKLRKNNCEPIYISIININTVHTAKHMNI